MLLMYYLVASVYGSISRSSESVSIYLFFYGRIYVERRDIKYLKLILAIFLVHFSFFSSKYVLLINNNIDFSVKISYALCSRV